MEETVIGVYNLGKLDVKMLKVLAKPYKGTDIDSGGSQNMKTKDGKSVEDLIIKLMAPNEFKKLEATRLMLAKHPKKYEKKTDEQKLAEEMYGERCYDVFYKITHKMFGWR